MLIRLLAASGLIVTAQVAAAQEERGPLFLTLEGLYSSQLDADLDGGGSFSVDRSFLRAGGFYSFGGSASAGFFVGGGTRDYDFGGGAVAPWGDITDIAITAPIRYAPSDALSLFIAPSLRYDYESGASRSSGETYGFFAGASWTVSERLSIGPAFGLFSEIASDDLNIFPALVIDWDITDRLNLSTGPTIAASQGPGLALNYSLDQAMTIGLAGRYESARFRLNDLGPAPGGVGEDSSFPLVVTFDYSPNPGFGLSAFAGAELGGELSVEDASGTVIDTRDYDPAPIFGAAFRLAF